MLRARPLARTLGTRRFHVVFAASSIPHPEKVAKGGEDAFFCDDATGAFGVADGVGGSASASVDPGKFSRRLLRYCEPVLDGTPDRLSLALAAAGKGFKAEPLGGSSTLLIGQLEPAAGGPLSGEEAERGTLRLLNIGDCGAMLLRPSVRRFRQGTFTWPRLVLRSTDQTHYFNCPYQLSAEDAFEQAEDHDEICADARPGDLLVVATDGVLDNLFDGRVQIEVAQHLAEALSDDSATARKGVEAIAKAIGQAAAETGLRQDEEGLATPFAAAAAEEGYKFAGGKLDDVAVLVGVVRRGSAQAPRRLGNLG